MSIYHLIVALHIIAALVWLGGIFFFALVGAPVLRRIPSDELRAQLFRQLGEQFRVVGWIAIAVLIVTGVLNLSMRELLNAATLASESFWRTAFGTALKWKLSAVGAMLTLQAIHDFGVGPASSRLQPGSPEALRMRRRAAWLARISAVLGLIIVLVAVRLARPGA